MMYSELPLSQISRGTGIRLKYRKIFDTSSFIKKFEKN